MDVVRWPRDRGVGAVDPRAIDDLDGVALLILDGVRPDDQVRWARRAPCVVVAIGSSGPGDVDVVVPEHDVDRLVGAVAVNPSASRMLVDVLRAGAGMGVEGALVLESLAYSLLMTGPEHSRWLAEAPARAPRAFADAEPVRVGRDGTTLSITLARPENRNAYGAALRDALVDALALAEVDPTIDLVVIRGDGRSFSSGGDLTEFGSARDAVRAHEIRTLRSAGAALARMSASVAIEVQGPCVGAGLELSAFAGRLTARPDATFRLPEVSMGLIPGAGGTVSVTRRIGRQRCAQIALLGDAVPADVALEWGLVDAIQ